MQSDKHCADWAKIINTIWYDKHFKSGAFFTLLCNGVPWFTGRFWQISSDFITVPNSDSGQSGLTSNLVGQNKRIVQWKCFIQLGAIVTRGGSLTTCVFKQTTDIVCSWVYHDGGKYFLWTLIILYWAINILKIDAVLSCRLINNSIVLDKPPLSRVPTPNVTEVLFALVIHTSVIVATFSSSLNLCDLIIQNLNNKNVWNKKTN